MSNGLDFDLLRVTIEMTTASIVTAGEAGGVVDAVFVTDANGLPYIPGTSIAGVLRHALAGEGDPDTDKDCREAFGYQAGNEAQASRIRISGAQVHDSHDRPVPFIGVEVDDNHDVVLRTLLKGGVRDHVRIGEHGAVDGDGKYDQRIVPAGARFTFEVTIDKDANFEVAELLGLLQSPAVRLGGHSRRGLGAFKVVRALHRRFDLRKKDDWAAWGRLPVALHLSAEGLVNRPVPTPGTRAGMVTGTIELVAVDTFLTQGRVATGREPKSTNRDGSARDVSKRVPLSEPRITWTAGASARGEVARDTTAPWLVPGSGIKGALRHRTLFHARRLRIVDPATWDVDPDLAVNALFGAIKSRDLDDSGQPGRVFIDDVQIGTQAKAAVLQHVSLDRLTQGPMSGLLFDEVALLGVPLSVPISIELRADLPKLALEAFHCAVGDLCEGRLPLGAGRSHGRFKGKVKWTGKAPWRES